MKNSTKNKLKMYDAVIAVCTLHQNDWGFVPALEPSFEVFRNDHTVLRAKLDAHGVSTTGQTRAKYEALGLLLPKAYEFYNALVLLAEANGDFVLMARNTISRSALSKGGVAVQTARFNLLKQDAETHIVSLADMGLTPTDLAQLISAIDTYRIATIEPRQAILNRKQLTRDIDVLHAKMDELLRTKLDRYMVLMGRFVPDFARMYTDARAIPDYKGRTTQVNIEPPEPLEGGNEFGA